MIYNSKNMSQFFVRIFVQLEHVKLKIERTQRAVLNS